MIVLLVPNLTGTKVVPGVYPLYLNEVSIVRTFRLTAVTLRRSFWPLEASYNITNDSGRNGYPSVTQ